MVKKVDSAAETKGVVEYIKGLTTGTRLGFIIFLAIGGALLQQVFLKHPMVYANKDELAKVEQKVDTVKTDILASLGEMNSTLSAMGQTISDALSDTKVNASKIENGVRSLTEHSRVSEAWKKEIKSDIRSLQ